MKHLKVMARHELSIVEKFILVFTALIIVTGFLMFKIDPILFGRFVVEDGLVEWLTVCGLLLGSIVCLIRFFKLLGKRNWLFLTVTIGLGLMLIFGAGEEISWGQRLLGLKSSEFFDKNNAQGETNFHNLVVDGVKLNKLIFSVMLSIAMGIYLVVFPLLYRYKLRFRSLLNFSGIPVPRTYQVISFILLIIVTSLLKNEKNAELLECGTALLFFLIISYPMNISVFKSDHTTSEE